MLYSEIFKSMQGEGLYTGYPSLWLRLFSCNLNCNGFGQVDPTDESTYELPYEKINIEGIKSIQELPVFSKGCDSSYSWARRFRHLNIEEDAETVIKRLEKMLPVPGVWNKENGYNYHMVYTGGEPLLKRNQKHIIEMLKIWSDREYENRPSFYTIETNGTQVIDKELVRWFDDVLADEYGGGGELFISFSPKLYTVSGEKNERAIKPENIHKTLDNLCTIDHSYQLKFVIGPEQRQWDELEQVIDQIGLGRDRVWIMPVGGTVEEQELHAGDVADMAVDRGYKVSARVHNYLWSNVIGK